MTQRTVIAAVAVTLVLAGCGYYAPPIRPDEADAPAEITTDARDDARSPADDASSGESDD